MHARTVALTFERVKVAEGLRVYRDEVIPAAQKEPGFAGAILLLDRDIGHATSISLWQTPEALAATDASGYYVDQVKRLAPYFVSAPEREDYDVGVFARSEATDPPKWARVVRANFHASKADEGVKMYEKGLIAESRKQAGFVAAQLLINRTSGQAISISLWSSEDALSGGEISPYYIGQIFKLIPFVASLPDREQYEVGFYLDLGPSK